MPDPMIQCLSLKSVPRGTHGDGLDLGRFLYRGASGNNRTRDIDARIAKGEFGQPLMERMELLNAVRSEIDSSPSAVSTKIALFYHFSFLVRWDDEQSVSTRLTIADAKGLYLDYADHLHHRCSIIKDLGQRAAHQYAWCVARILGPVLDPESIAAHQALVALTPLRPPRQQRKLRGIHADKQRMDETFAFGELLADVCNALSADAVRGPIPITVELRARREPLVLSGPIKNTELDPKAISHKGTSERAAAKRLALPEGVHASCQRASLINLRIQCEMLIFIAQTGMNLAQVKNEPRAEYRWQTSDEDYKVRAVYKGRRQGIAAFVVFKAYQDHLVRYIQWLDTLALNEDDDRLFPFVYATQIPPAHVSPQFGAIRSHCKSLHIQFFSPRTLRNTRLNWLLRRSRDASLTAELMAHDRGTLLRVYEIGNLQTAAQEIGAYHSKNDPTIAESRFTPACLKGSDGPRPFPDAPSNAPKPDCITPEGCLWCVHARDVLSHDYCWRLASHKRLKLLELSLYCTSSKQADHPAKLVVDRLNAKLAAIQGENPKCFRWAIDAQDAVREGSYHPSWDALIRLLEELV
jgi:hypothetical protein